MSETHDVKQRNRTRKRWPATGRRLREQREAERRAFARVHTVCTVLTADEQEVVRDAAKQCQMTVSDFVRTMLLTGMQADIARGYLERYE